MENEGNALLDHGHEMSDEVNCTRAEGWLSPDLARQALDRAQEIVALGERLSSAMTKTCRPRQAGCFARLANRRWGTALEVYQ